MYKIEITSVLIFPGKSAGGFHGTAPQGIQLSVTPQIQQRSQRRIQRRRIVGTGDSQPVSFNPAGHQAVRRADVPDHPPASDIVVKFSRNQVFTRAVGTVVVDADEHVAVRHIREGLRLRHVSDVTDVFFQVPAFWPLTPMKRHSISG